MFCSGCGAKLEENARFCPECGTKVENAQTGVSAIPDVRAPAHTSPSGERGLNGSQIQGRRVTENICLCPDGVYRWVYEYRMMHDPTILFTVWKVLGISFGAVYLLNLIFMLFDGDLDLEALGSFTFGFAVLFAVFLVIGFIAYVIVASQNGWKYTVMFEMDENGIDHKQMQPSVQKADVLRDIGVLAGLMTGNLTAVGSAMLIKTSMYSEFSKVKNIKVLRSRHIIKVNELLGKNQVYAEAADFDFVLDYISSRLPADARVK